MGNRLGSVRSDYRTLREIVQERLRQDILSARLRPGQKLIETELAQAYGLSRGPIREALRALEGQGLVRFLSNRGAVVASLSDSDLREIYDMRAELEGLATRLSVPLVKDGDLATLEELLARMDESVQSGDVGVWLALNEQFHMALYRTSERTRLCLLVAELMASIQPYIRLFLDDPRRLIDTHADHRLILGAVRARDAARAEALTEEHLHRAAEMIVQLAAAYPKVPAMGRNI